jgi:hypothetical protein
MTVARGVFPTRLPADRVALILLDFALGFFGIADAVSRSGTDIPVDVVASSTTLLAPLSCRFLLEGFAMVNNTPTRDCAAVRVNTKYGAFIADRHGV